jgi:dihydroorotate dehydrogenase electron transfer subunit
VEEEIIRYIEVAKYLDSEGANEFKNIDHLINSTIGILPQNKMVVFKSCSKDKEFRTQLDKIPSTTNTYNTFCFNVLNLLMRKLRINICYINDNIFDSSFLELNINRQSIVNQDKTITENCAFIAKNDETNLIFSFGHQSEKVLEKLSKHIYSIDSNRYENIHIIIFKNSEELNEARDVNKANFYKRSFFTSFDKICSKVLEIDKDSFEKIFSNDWKYGQSKNKHQIAHLQNIAIIDNIPVGKDETNLYKLTFKTDDSIDILPGQFIMIDTLKERHNEILNQNKPQVVKSISNVKPNNQNDLNAKRLSFLKRPFGIYRTYYENFSFDCSSKLNLDKDLAGILYTIKPNKFDILYKVLGNGIGTNELTKLVKGDRVEILAPLGKIFDLREIIKEDIDEIHIVGGGVGIAPLIYLVQMLRYFNIKVKAFIGIVKYSSLTYLDEDIDPQSFTGTGRNAKIYVDDLKFLGLSETSDIYISFESDSDEDETIEIKNVFKRSFITGPYSDYLKKNNNLKILTFTCGPTPMMHKVHNITDLYKIKSYVLLEKRMACGIGVCFSCVCKTLVNGENHYSRVCIDGPIIESKQINWNESA